ncbi:MULTISPECIES: alanine/glycine:cation symporter family protein [Pasteurellaceae]|uniref:Alanine/glycine:cation symporter family protein n=1 Tax=Pasteurella atlantica TaxID=2827233 RepID=A0AAW8CFU1_9PAST|nr:alanine/glycine:cation symporter family protein [Pasteurella atlantica]MBR0573813.1 alanine:cation symporter family protein [Pasteurella atlantica]MDP8039749.1 alanine/glycine:cation symporter family protein [Pasteurella atlantica]MDP8041934.1 alanine/glycine:cation symporter family protein [Pasteurella atlantica]MDP8044041.1 alanine/glycine:cation symporter family protein [Pasteurella atlantica]MDP8046019.1 alanine/glycine:cation symporter family protein [Pasteurella atlantica]
MEYIHQFFDTINDLTWGWALIPMLIVFGLLFTTVGGFAQFRYFGRMFNVFKSEKESHDPDSVSSRQALLVSIGGRVGGGNIAGVAVAISLGGPGAVFWMWVVALIGMMTSIVECSLAQLYKRKEADGTYRGGPAHYILHGLGPDYRWLAVIYAVALTLSFSIGFNAFQGNTVAGAALDSLGIDRLYTGIFLVVFGGLVIFGGIKRIAKAADIIVPLMSLIYLLLAIVVIVINITEVPALIISVVKNAFGIDSVVGGGMGVAIAQGMRRGLFSNEAGLGSAPNVAATAKANHPVSQGISQALSVFIDTMLICSATAFIILLGDVYQPGVEIDGVVLTQQSLVGHFGNWVSYLLTFSILLFSFSSIIYNYYMGENGVSFLAGSAEKAKVPVFILRLAVIGILFLGAVAPGATDVFFFSDPLMGVLALTNLLALIMLFPRAVKLLKDYRNQLDAGIEEPIFDAQQYERLDIDIDAWERHSDKNIVIK